MRLGFAWTPHEQMIVVDGDAFSHDGKINTAPSHDVAHLLCAASGLPWKPSGTREIIARVEFSAVFVEHLLTHIFDAVMMNRAPRETIIERTVSLATWFVREHYAPFPVAPEIALAELRGRVQAEPLVRLSPAFFRMRAIEIMTPDYEAQSFAAEIDSRETLALDHLTKEPQAELARQLAAWLS